MRILEQSQKEIWKDIKGYEGFYEISNMGRVRSKIKNRLLKPVIHKKGGYLRVHLGTCNRKYNKSKKHMVHRLVMDNFKPNLNSEILEIDHINCNTQDNRLENLEWVTSKENTKRAYANNLIKNEKKTLQLDKNSEEIIAEYKSAREAGRAVANGCYGNIINCCLGKVQTAYGYKWRYKNDYIQ